MRKLQNSIIPLIVLFLSLGWLHAAEPQALYLTWMRDPTSTMVIQWHTGSQETASAISYRARGDESWLRAEGSGTRFQKSDVLVHRLELQGLTAGTDYVFRIGEEGKEGTEYWFRTMAASIEEKPIRFVVAGDAYYFYYLFEKMNVQIAKADPDFVVVGGDIAYTENHPSFFKGANWQLKRWQAFLSPWRTTLVGAGGRLIPFLAVIGNHDIKKVKEENLSSSSEGKPAFFELFAMPEEQKAYRALDFGSYLSFIFLDTGHSASIAGEQTEWLREALKARQDGRWKIAAYHMGAYPSVYSYDAATTRRIRYQWIPFFEEYGVNTAFEHHNHAYKRTHRIKAGKVDPEGVQYLGDGCWGTAPRSPKKGLWYMARTEQLNHFWLVTLGEGDCRFESRDIHGKTIEVVTSSRSLSNSELDLSTNLESDSAPSSLLESSESS